MVSSPHRPPRQLPAALAGVLLGALACGPGQQAVVSTIESYAAAVQAQDYDALFCLSAGAAEAAELGDDLDQRREGFIAWADAQYEHYLDGRDAGWVELDDQGIVLVKLFSLGRGAFYSVDSQMRADGAARRVLTPVNFGYAQIDLSRLSPGTTFYLSGVPAGKVHPVRIPSGAGEVRLEAMDSVIVEWKIERVPANRDCAARWGVASARVVEGSARASEITWLF